MIGHTIRPPKNITRQAIHWNQLEGTRGGGGAEGCRETTKGIGTQLEKLKGTSKEQPKIECVFQRPML